MTQTKKTTNEQSTLVAFFQTPLTPILLNILHYIIFTVLALLSISAIVLGMTGALGFEWYAGFGAVFVFGIVYVFARIGIECLRVVFDIERNTRQ